MLGIRTRLRAESLRRQVARLEARNRTSSETVLGPDGPVVSFTSFGRRLERCFLTVESIGLGRLLPSRLILWLDEPEDVSPIPLSLQRLQDRGLEIFPCDPLGPHKKYFPYLEAEDTLASPLVTADDDMIYSRSWLAGLRRASEAGPLDIHAYRARRVTLGQPGFAPYAEWPLVQEPGASILNLATGSSGVMYPPSFLKLLRERGRAFLECCPRADDIWLHHTALRTGHKVAPIEGRSVYFPTIPGSQEVSLTSENVGDGRNDEQLAATYSVGDIDLLRRQLQLQPLPG